MCARRQRKNARPIRARQRGLDLHCILSTQIGPALGVAWGGIRACLLNHYLELRHSLRAPAGRTTPRAPVGNCLSRAGEPDARATLALAR